MAPQIQTHKPIYAQCHICFKKYDMVKWGIRCPTCKDKPKQDNKYKDGTGRALRRGTSPRIYQRN